MFFLPRFSGQWPAPSIFSKKRFLRTAFCLVWCVAVLYSENAWAVQPVEVIRKNPQDFLINQGPAMCASTAFYMIFRYYGDHEKKPPFFFDETGKPLNLLETPQDFLSSKKGNGLKRLSKTAKIAQWINPEGGATKWSKLKHGAEDLYFKPHPKKPAERYYTRVESNDALIKNKKKNRAVKKEIMLTRIVPLLDRNQPVLVHLSRAHAPGHYIVVIGYDTQTNQVYYVDPNEKDKSAIIRRIDYNAFATTRWYKGHVPKLWGKAVWSGKFLSFKRDWHGQGK